MSDQTIVEVKDLHVHFVQYGELVPAVNGVDLAIREGMSVGIVGESGCGKTVTGYSLLGLLPSNARIPRGEIWFRNRNGQRVDITKLDPDGPEMRQIRGSELSIVFQEPMAAFSPVHTVGSQIVEAIQLHRRVNRREARQLARELLAQVGIPNPDKRLDEYPFQYSGGMLQRAMIAMALASSPRVLVADEPTTALDVTIQAQVMGVIKKMQENLGLSLILITHDLGLIAHMVDFVYVMYLGRVVEEGPVREVLQDPKHPYTRELLKSIPRLSHRRGQKIYPIPGAVPSPLEMPSGCAFHPRCRAIIGDLCRQDVPGVSRIGDRRAVRCFIYAEKGEVS